MTVGYAAAFERGPLHGAVVHKGKVWRLFTAVLLNHCGIGNSTSPGLAAASRTCMDA